MGLHFIQTEGGHFVSPTVCVDRYEAKGHETIIRELTQNALDAAMREAKRTCKLKFEICKIPTSIIPGIAKCKEHLGYMQRWEQQKQQKFDDVLNQLKQLYDTTKTSEVSCLLVIDNGVGLDAGRMVKMFGEGDSGKSEKDGASGGTHGVGHKTAFAAGDMNYVLYGGVNLDKSGKTRRTASGHVMFPSHNCCVEGEISRFDGHAYLVSNKNQSPNLRI